MLDSLSPYSGINPAHSRSAAAGLDENHVSTASEPHQATSRRIKSEISPEHNSSPKKDHVQISVEAREIAKLETRDREVRSHEAAHAAVGGAYAGAPVLTYRNGPDGRSYATGGEVSIDLSPVSGDPLATLQKAEIVRAAALAPAQPSAQDMRVASRAAAMATQARADLTTEVNNGKGELSGAVISDAHETIPGEISQGNSAAE